MKFSVFSWNVQGDDYLFLYRKVNFEKIAPVLEDSGADIFCLQEMPRAKEKISKLNPLNSYQPLISSENYDCVLTKLPVLRSGELNLPKFSNGKSHQSALWLDIKLGARILRVYNCHFPIARIGIAERLQLLKFVLADARGHTGPAIICGDMNTTIPAKGIRRQIVQRFYRVPAKSLFVDGEYYQHDERQIFSKIAESAGFKEVVDLSKPTWGIWPLALELFGLKLDWFLVRDVEISDINLGPYISDHRLILAQCSVS